MITVFKTPTLIDLTALTTFGVSAKTTENPIGYFGTGLKYAIAILLRNKAKITLHRGKTTYSFTTKKKTVRGKPFSVVCMNGEPLGFTDDVGKNWDLWQAFRELHCNTLDEEGTTTVFPSSTPTAPEPRTTKIIIEHTAFAKIAAEPSKIVIDTVPVYTVPNELEIHPVPTRHLYYRGIRVSEHSAPALFHYNLLTEQTLTEDRTLRYTYSATCDIRQAITKITDKSLLHKILAPQEKSFESTLEFSGQSHTVAPSAEFIEVSLLLDKGNDPLANRSAASFSRRVLQQKDPEAHSVVLNSIQSQQLTRALRFCRQININTEEYNILLLSTLPSNCLGQAKEGKILISMQNFSMGTKQLAATLMEEYFHLKHGYSDCTREFQDFLLLQYVTVAEEHIFKEAL